MKFRHFVPEFTPETPDLIAGPALKIDRRCAAAYRLLQAATSKRLRATPMIDHVSLAVRDLVASAEAYERMLTLLGLVRLVERSGTVGFGKRYPELWL